MATKLRRFRSVFAVAALMAATVFVLARGAPSVFAQSGDFEAWPVPWLSVYGHVPDGVNCTYDASAPTCTVAAYSTQWTGRYAMFEMDLASVPAESQTWTNYWGGGKDSAAYGWRFDVNHQMNTTQARLIYAGADDLLNGNNQLYSNASATWKVCVHYGGQATAVNFDGECDKIQSVGAPPTWSTTGRDRFRWGHYNNTGASSFGSFTVSNAEIVIVRDAVATPTPSPTPVPGIDYFGATCPLSFNGGEEDWEVATGIANFVRDPSLEVAPNTVDPLTGGFSWDVNDWPGDLNGYSEPAAHGDRSWAAAETFSPNGYTGFQVLPDYYFPSGEYRFGFSAMGRCPESELANCMAFSSANMGPAVAWIDWENAPLVDGVYESPWTEYSFNFMVDDYDDTGFVETYSFEAQLNSPGPSVVAIDKVYIVPVDFEVEGPGEDEQPPIDCSRWEEAHPVVQVTPTLWPTLTRFPTLTPYATLGLPTPGPILGTPVPPPFGITPVATECFVMDPEGWEVGGMALGDIPGYVSDTVPAFGACVAPHVIAVDGEADYVDDTIGVDIAEIFTVITTVTFAILGISFIRRR